MVGAARGSRPLLKGYITGGVVFILFILLVGETMYQKFTLLHSIWSSAGVAQCDGTAGWETKLQNEVVEKLPQGNSSAPMASLKIRAIPALEQAFEGKTTFLANSTERAPKGLISQFQDNHNVKGYGLTEIRHVCMKPDGPIILVGISEAEVHKSLEASPSLKLEWHSAYNCSWGCTGLEMVAETPQDAVWVKGNTTHILPYLGNVFHNFAERVWPHIAGFQFPLHGTTAKPINHFVVQGFSSWMEQSHHNVDRHTLMFQIAMLSQLSPAANFLLTDGLHTPVCYESLTLACTTCDRISNFLGEDITTPALIRYRDATLSFFGVPEPEVSLPPHPLRVTFYGRGDVTRRRVKNAPEVVQHLRMDWTSPLLQVTFADDLLLNGDYKQTLPEVVSLFSQTDLFITVHGANTWAALFMPTRSGVVEVYGPCGPGSWLGTIATALSLKHSTKANPWAQKFASPKAGDTIECEDALRTPDFTYDIAALDTLIHHFMALPDGPGDRLPLHWLYNWTSHSYV